MEDSAALELLVERAMGEPLQLVCFTFIVDDIVMPDGAWRRERCGRAGDVSPGHGALVMLGMTLVTLPACLLAGLRRRC